MTEVHTPTEMSKGQSDNTNNTTKKFDYTAVADRLRTVSWSNYTHPTVAVNLVYRYKMYWYFHTSRKKKDELSRMYRLWGCICFSTDLSSKYLPWECS